MDQTDDYSTRAKLDNGEKFKKANKDPFAVHGEELKKVNGLSPNFKRKVSRLSKAWGEGQDGAKTKQLVPEMEMISAYGLFDVIIPPYNLDEFASFYESSFANHAAIDSKVSNIVGLGYHFDLSMRTMERLEQAESEDQLQRAHRKLERQKNELIEWLESTNSDETFTHALEKVWTDYEAVGNGYLEIGRKVTGEIGYIGHIPATTVRVRRLKDGFVQIVNQHAVFFRNFQDRKTPNPIGGDTRPNEIIHFKNYTPRNSFYGVPDILSAGTAVVGDQLAGRYNIDYFENKAVPRYIVTLKGAKLSIDAEDKLFRFLQSGMRGQNHRTLYIPLPGDSPDNKVEFKMDPVENGVQEGSFEKYRRSNKDDILMAHQTPISKVGGGQGISIAAALAQDRTFKEQVSRPAQRNLEKIINKIIAEKTDMFKFKLNELTLTDEVTQSQIDERYLKTQVYVPNEVRTRMGLPMRDGGQEPIILSAQQRAEAAEQLRGNRERDTQRQNNASDSTSTTAGRNPGGEGRSSQ